MCKGRGHRRTYVIKSSAPTSSTVKKKNLHIYLIKYFNTYTDTNLFDVKPMQQKKKKKKKLLKNNDKEKEQIKKGR